MFEHLLSPGRIGQLELRNRILMAPMGSNLSEPDGHMGERIKRYYEARAAGGAGLLIVGVGAVAYPAGACNPNQVAISDDVFLPGLEDFTRRIHAHGARVAIQLQHAGKVAVRDMEVGRPMWVPSQVPYKRGDLTADLTPEELQQFVQNLTRPGARMAYHVMEKPDIEVLIERFASAADRARRAGFDGVELHAGHGYILSSFLSPASNHREDEYGGPVENRARLLVEVIRAVKERAGSDFPVWCRLDAKEFRTPGGIGEEDARITAELAEAAGADAIHVSAYADSSSGVAFTDAPLVHRPAGYVELAAGIKQRVTIPVIAVGRIEPEQADRLIAEGRADFVAMARKLLADPELPNKLAAGRPGAVRPCIYCYTCVGQIFLNGPSCCAVNAASGREADFQLEPAARPKHVLVVGGGPAGMEAARILALRGHRVTLCEKDRRLGGTAFFSSLVNPANGELVRWLAQQVAELPIDVRLSYEVTPERARSLGADEIIVAVGASHAPSRLSGADRKHVLSGDDLRSLLTGGDGRSAGEKLVWHQRMLLAAGRWMGVADRVDLTRALSRHWMPIGRRVVIIGGSLVGVELAAFLAERGREVQVLEEGPTWAAEMAPPRRWRVLHELREAGVTLRKGVRVVSIEAGEVVLEALARPDAEAAPGGGRERVPADHVILATGTGENEALTHALAATGRPVHAIGDCTGLGYIKGAIWQAARLAHDL